MTRLSLEQRRGVLQGQARADEPGRGHRTPARSGYTRLNAPGPSAPEGRGPFGGFKHSGIGRNLGCEGVIQFQGYHSISGPAGWLV